MAAPINVGDRAVQVGEVVLNPILGIDPALGDPIPGLETTGQLLSLHDAKYRYADQMVSNGTPIDMDGASKTGMPRWGLADGAVQRVKTTFEIGALWDAVTVRFFVAKETAVAGNVNLTFFYRLYYPFAGTDIDAGAVTDIVIPPFAVPGTQFATDYRTPSQLEDIATPAEAVLGSVPFMMCGFERDGVTDTYNGVFSIAAITMTRTG